MDQQQSPLLRLPTEIKLIIWDMLFLPGHGISAAKAVSRATTQSHEQDANPEEPWTIHIHNLPPSESGPPPLHRSTYLIRNHTTLFTSRTTRTTYALALPPNTPPSTPLTTIYPFRAAISLLATCKYLHATLTPLLYSSYSFSFATNIEAIPPFLADRGPLARAHIRHLALTKRAAPYTLSADAAAWTTAMAFLAAPSSGLRLDSIDLGVQALIPGGSGAATSANADDDDTAWAALPVVDSGWFRAASCMGVFGGGAGGGEGLGWAEQMHRVRGLSCVTVRGVRERCAMPTSAQMVFWVGFSRSIELGFRRWCWEEMVRGGA
ncbi:hypothetical protein EJ05DRAFT_264133 [Pseudovirgaria hyperparasitica]|uniref:Uncharacterized protein n=1 Tax=Pseudovirgaria hyperparasitica TaxID=470096 RepID=A0A6A6WIE3_9PEZI|nr:uncharacterized protein EJ05DRAFT_264133 [Pseudovirgaria hyperparasitica]KAF2761427.1 hypothetical protein EJ05DRAFT_264133 [Pseudovirgaria hyperparasitica]